MSSRSTLQAKDVQARTGDPVTRSGSLFSKEEYVRKEGYEAKYELIHKHRKRTSIIFCSQFREEGWYNKFGGKDSPLSDDIMDRISYDSYKIAIENIDPDKDISMREVYGLDPKLAQ